MHDDFHGKDTIHAVIVLISFCGLFLLFFSPVIFSDRIFTSDGLLSAFYAPIELWTPLLYSGFPLQAAIEWQNLYPLRFIFQPLPDGLDFNLFVMSAYVLAACFTYGYIHTLTRSIFASAGAAIVFSMSGFMMAHLGHTSMIHATAWLPLMIGSVEKLRGGFSWGWFILTAFAVALSVFAGHPQIFVYSLSLSGIYILFRGAGADAGMLRYWGRCFLAIFSGLGMAALQLLPTWELSQASVRESLDFAQFVSYSLPPRELPALIFPYLFGHPTGGEGSYAYFGTWGLTETTGYVGIFTLLLALIAGAGGKPRSLVLFWAVVAVGALLLALGDATPAAGIMYELPVMGLFRVQARHFMEMSFAMSVLAGLGLYALESRVFSTARLGMLLAVACLFVTGMLLIVALDYDVLQALSVARGVHLPPLPDNHAVLTPLWVFLAGLILVALAWRFQGRIARLAAHGLLLCLMVADLGVFGFFYEWRFVSSLSPEQLALPPKLANYAATLRENQQRLQPLQGLWQGQFAPNLSHYQNIPSGSGYGPFLLKDYKYFLGMNTPGYLYSEQIASIFHGQDRTLDILSVRYIVNLAPPSAERLARMVGADEAMTGQYLGWLDSLRENTQRWRLVDKMGDMEIYENMNVLPRTWLVSEVVSAQAEQIMQTIRTSLLPDGKPFQPRHIALVEEPLAFKEQPDLQASSTLVLLENTRLEIETDSTNPAFLVLSDVFYPGWQASIDGAKTPIFKTNYLLRGIRLPAGKHRVVFEYRPRYFSLGIGIAGAIILVLILLRIRPLTSRRSLA
jgi:hypothetical protein